MNAVARLGLVAKAVPFGTFPLVNEYPKSGGSWMAQMLADALDLPFPRNRLPMMRSSILHGHYRVSKVRQPAVLVWRDGRDVMVSLYFHRIIGNDLTLSSQTHVARKALGIKDPLDVKTYLPRFIELVAHGQTHPRYSWATFVNEWHGSPKAVHEVKYEEMLENASQCLIDIAAAFGRNLGTEDAQGIVAKYSFEKQSGRAAGTENSKSYLRKGVAGDWMDKFDHEARQVFDHHMGDALIALGYEKNSDWVR